MRERAEPPPGSPWDDPLERAPLAFVDLEMSGLDVARDRVVQVCVERVVGDACVCRCSTFVRPDERTIEVGSAAVHGIDAALLASAPPFVAVAAEVCALLDGAIFVAHAAEWDVAFLRTELARIGIAWDAPHHLCTLALSRRAWAMPSHRLHALGVALGIPCERPHRADYDVALLRALFPRLCAALQPASARDLWHVRVGARRARPAIVAAATEAQQQGRPVTIRYRPSGRAPQELCFRVTAVRTDLDPPLVLGYLHPGRGRRELRSDRILAIEPLP